MQSKDMKRTDWGRVLRKDYIARDFRRNGHQGRMSLSILRELTAPLTIHYPFGDVLIADEGFGWLQIALKEQSFWITAMCDRQGQRISLYFDVTAGNCFDNPDNPCFADLYLDIVAIGDVLEVLDRDELDEALETGDITREEYDHAISVCRKPKAVCVSGRESGVHCGLVQSGFQRTEKCLHERMDQGMLKSVRFY